MNTLPNVLWNPYTILIRLLHPYMDFSPIGHMLEKLFTHNQLYTKLGQGIYASHTFNAVVEVHFVIFCELFIYVSSILFPIVSIHLPVYCTSVCDQGYLTNSGNFVQLNAEMIQSNLSSQAFSIIHRNHIHKLLIAVKKKCHLCVGYTRPMTIQCFWLVTI